MNDNIIINGCNEQQKKIEKRIFEKKNIRNVVIYFFMSWFGFGEVEEEDPNAKKLIVEC